ncbi:MAG: peptide-methionine (R)-S-oxide reductase [Pyrinomonadaceae bacterium]|jgi:peptide-methionine (R)-S-oxide reductase|nr:peptide-methionine (R)-S-oxide reductase [Pyrinomonadaceae bacterium]
MNRRYFIKSGATLGAAAVLLRLPLVDALAQRAVKGGTKSAGAFKKVVKTDEEWKRILTAEQYHVMREKGTEAPGASPLLKNYAKGTYVCVGCALPLFSSRTRYDSHTGWPSFWSPISKRNVLERPETAEGDTRTEVVCNRCDAHLGHVFDDGPDPTGLRYCMNGVALKFVPAGRRA